MLKNDLRKFFADEKEKLKHSVEYIQQWMDAIPSYTKQEKEEKELDFERYLQRMKKAVKTLGEFL